MAMIARDDKTWANKSRRYRREAERIAGISNTGDTSVEVTKSQNVLGMHC
jgi:hypothetical protein